MSLVSGKYVWLPDGSVIFVSGVDVTSATTWTLEDVSSSSSSSSSKSSSSSSSSSKSSSSSSSRSSSSSSSRSSSSSSSSSAVQTTGCIVWGDDTGGGEDLRSWQTWHLVDGATISGDSDWGELKVGSMGGEYAVSEVVELPDASDHLITLTENAYGSGSGGSKISIRGQAGSFLWDDGSPSWEEYTVPIIRAWKYVQLKEEWV
jgi:hypothetical protein